MLGLGLASSHGRALWRKPEFWAQQMRLQPPGVLERFPETAGKELASLEYAQELFGRGRKHFQTFREDLEAYRPDALIMIGDDQGDMFNLSNNPTFAIYTGEDELWGRSGEGPDLPPPERPLVKFRNHVELSRVLLNGLIKRGFDITNCARFEPVGAPGVGLSHMASRILPEVDPDGKIPIICVLINEYFAPLPTAKRCADLGRAIAEVFANRPERVAIYASGGLSHYPRMANQGVIDIPLDTWVLERLERNDVAGLENLFTVDSDNMRSGTGEIRAWVSAAAAMNRPAEVLDYFPVHSGMLGIGFARWPQLDR